MTQNLFRLFSESHCVTQLQDPAARVGLHNSYGNITKSQVRGRKNKKFTLCTVQKGLSPVSRKQNECIFSCQSIGLFKVHKRLSLFLNSRRGCLPIPSLYPINQANQKGHWPREKSVYKYMHTWGGRISSEDALTIIFMRSWEENNS